MIDHVSISVADLGRAGDFYQSILPVIGFSRLVIRDNTIGFGKKYPEFWLNHRPGFEPSGASGNHVALRVANRELVDEFWRKAVKAGAEDFGRPGPRPEYDQRYYAGFFSDLDDHVIEAVCFLTP